MLPLSPPSSAAPPPPVTGTSTLPFPAIDGRAGRRRRPSVRGARAGLPRPSPRATAWGWPRRCGRGGEMVAVVEAPILAVTCRGGQKGRDAGRDTGPGEAERRGGTPCR